MTMRPRSVADPSARPVLPGEGTGAGSTPRDVTIVIAAGFLVMFLSMGTRQSFGLYLEPMTSDLGWGREAFSIAIAIQNLIWGIAQPFAGAVADRYGPARVVLVGGLLYVVGLVVMGLSQTPLMFNAGAGLLVGLALSGVTFAVVLGAVGRIAPEKSRGMALGIAAAGGSAGQFLLLWFNHWTIQTYGWSASLLVLAAIVAVAVPLAFAYAGRFASDAASGTQQSLGAAVREAGGHSGFWLLTAGFFVCGFQVTFIMNHLPAYVADTGLPPWVGATSLVLIGFFNIIGSFICGWAGDHYRKKYALVWLYVLRSAVVAVFILLPPSMPSALAFGALMGLLWLGTVPLTSGLLADVFGPRYMTTLFGIVFFAHQAGSALGVWYGGYAFDATGSYDHVWYATIGLGLIAAILHWPINDEPIARAAPAAT